MCNIGRCIVNYNMHTKYTYRLLYKSKVTDTNIIYYDLRRM